MKCSTTIGKGLEETLKNIHKHTTPFAPTFIIISDYEEEQVKEKATKEIEWVLQLVCHNPSLGRGEFCEFVFVHAPKVLQLRINELVVWFVHVLVNN